MKQIAAAACAAWLGVVPATTRAASVVSEAEFLAVLDESHPAVAAGRGEIGEARATELAAGVLRNPELSAVREDPSGVTSQLDLTVSWQLPGLGRKPLRDSAGRSVRAAEARVADGRLDLRRELRTVYAEWAAANAEADLLSRQIATLRRLAQRERARAERGEVAGLEASRLELAVAELDAQAALADAGIAAALARARGWSAGLPPDARPSLPALPPVPTLPPPDHPRLVALEHEVEAARLAHEAAGRFLPTPEVTAGWQHLDTGGTSSDGPIVGLRWPLPASDRNQAQRAATEVRLRTAEARLRSARSRIAAEREGAQAAYRRLAEATAAARLALSGDRMAAAVEAAFRSGESSLTDLLETLRSVRSAELTVLGLHVAALEAHRDLERLAGAPLQLGDDR